MFFLFFAFLVAGLPIGVSIGASSLLTLVMEDRVPLYIIPQKMFFAINSGTLMAIPFFMLVGSIMERSGITDRLVDFANAIVGWIKGGMCYVSVVAGMLMGGISGSAPADTAALSSIMIPSMKKLGYPGSLAAALQAVSGCIGIIIPPSLPMIVLSSLTGISVAKLFLGGIIPGILIGLSLMVIAAIVVRNSSYAVPMLDNFSWSYLWQTFKGAFLPLLAPVIIVGGILTGMFTATESGVMALMYTLFLGTVVYRTIKISQFPELFLEAVGSASNVMLIIAASSLFSWILTANDFNLIVDQMFRSVSSSPIVIMLIINFIFFIGGMFLEGTALQIMFVPLLYPISQAVGVDPVAFGVTIVMNIALGTLTPPVGVCVFVASSSGNVPFEDVVKAVMPFLIALIINILLVIYIPEIITLIPNYFMK
ncbi:MAG: TRAP transporter large permease [Negativicutes bacterium]